MRDIDAIPGLREAVAHLEAAAAILRENAPNGFQVLIQEVIDDGARLEEIFSVYLLTTEEQAKNYGPIAGRQITHNWRRVWSGPVA